MENQKTEDNKTEDITEEERLLICEAKKIYIDEIKEKIKSIDVVIEQLRSSRDRTEKELIEKKEDFDRFSEENMEKAKKSKLCEDIIRKIDPDDFFLKKSLVHYMNNNKPLIFNNKILLEEKIKNYNDMIKDYEKIREKFFNDTFYNEK